MYSPPLFGCNLPRSVFDPYAREESSGTVRAKTRVERIGHEAKGSEGEEKWFTIEADIG
jgi:hypothetical protein